MALRGAQLTTVQEAGEALSFQGRSNNPDASGASTCFNWRCPTLPSLNGDGVGIEKVERVPVRNATATQLGSTEVLLSLSAPLNTGSCAVRC